MKIIALNLLIAALLVTVSLADDSSPHRTCPPVCAIFCPCGNVLDRYGCPTCRCNRCPPSCPPRVELCIYCKCGYVKDSHGCPTCRCKPCPQTTTIPCPTHTCGPVCLIYCECGNLLDRYGCPKCECNRCPRTSSEEAK
jgi:hypothetical protein